VLRAQRDESYQLRSPPASLKQVGEIGSMVAFVILARTSHRPSAAAVDPGMSIALRFLGLLDILSSMPAGPREPVRGLKGTAFRAPWSQMQGAAPPEPCGRMGIAGNLCVARRRRCALASTSSSRLELAAQATCARSLLIPGPAPWSRAVSEAAYPRPSAPPRHEIR